MFGKVMSVPDELIVKYYRLASTESVDKIDKIEAGLAAGELDPNKTKRALARNIVAAYYDDVAAEEAEAEFNRVHVEHQAPEDVPEFAADLTPNEEGTVYLARILQQAGMVQTVSEGRRKIDEGGVYINGERWKRARTTSTQLCSRTQSCRWASANSSNSRKHFNSTHVREIRSRIPPAPVFYAGTTRYSV